MKMKIKLRAVSIIIFAALVFIAGSVNMLPAKEHSGLKAELTVPGIYQSIIKRVFHDGYWWLQVYDETETLIYEYLDPDQD